MDAPQHEVDTASVADKRESLEVDASAHAAVAGTAVARRHARSLVLKIDLLLMPFCIILFGLAYADKAVLGSAAVGGILKDLDLSQTVINSEGKKVTSLTRYSTATALFYAGYAVSVLPSALIAARVKNIIYFIGSAVVLWGIVVILTPTIHQWQVLYAQRFFLGMIEATLSPCLVAITKSWYQKREHASRLGIWYASTGLFSIFSGLINFGLTEISNGSLAPWKVLYLFAGAFTIFFGALFLCLVPKSPFAPPLVPVRGYNVFTLGQQEEARRRIDEDGLEIVSDVPGSSRWAEVKESVLDVKMYLFALIAFSLYLTNGAVTAFGSVIVKSIYGYSGAHAIALQAPGGAVTVIAIVLTGFLSLRIPQSRIALLCLSCLPVILGALLLWLGPWSNKGSTLAGLWLLAWFGAPFVQLLAVATANVKGQIKPAIAAGVIFIAYSLSNVTAPYTFIASERGVKYETTWRIIIGAMCASIFFSALLALHMALENKRKARQQPFEGKPITDGMDTSFQYVF